MGELHYPNLSVCRVKLTSTTSSLRPPVSLPADVLNALNPPPPDTPHDFALERSVLKKKAEMERDQILMKATSRDELQNATVTKMKNVTGAADDLCVAMLESNGYDLKTSIEAFYLKR